MRGTAIATAWMTLAGMVLLLTPAVTAQSTARIGYVDVQRVFARSSAGVAAREQIERDKATMQKDLDARRVEIEKLEEEMVKKGALLSTEARKDKQEALDRKKRDFRRLLDDYQRELEKKDRELLQKLAQDLAGVVERFGKQRGYLLIVERRNAGVMYGAAEADLTDEIIKAYDQEMGRTKR